MKNLICFISHIINNEIVDLFKEISLGIPEDSDIIFVSPTSLDKRSDLSRLSEIRNFMKFGLDEIEDSLIDQNTYTFKSQLIFKKIYDLFFDKYNYYYLIEYDVRFNGDWSYLFQTLNRLNEDLVCSHLSYYNSIYEGGPYPRWKLKKMFSKEDRLIMDEFGEITENLCFSFLPFCRLSNRLMRVVNNYYKTFDGFFEIVIPTLCIENDFSPVDLDFLGFTNPPLEEMENYHFKCNSGSMSWYEEDKTVYKKPNILIHPVKPVF